MSERPTITIDASASQAETPLFVYRHSIIIRLTHWVVVGCVVLLLMSGLQIFNAHPALYFGQASSFEHPILSIGTAEKNGRETGVTNIFGRSFETTGVLGLSGRDNSDERAFPAWATLPSYQDLAGGRRWHFFFAWILVFAGSIWLIHSLASGHVWRDLIPSPPQIRDIGRSVRDHLRLRFPRGEEAMRYNVLQRLAYLIILFVVLPLLILAGLTMSPGLDAAFPGLTTAFGGRQSGRTVHFVCAFLLSGFVAVHVLMVLLSGVRNNLRSMITGWYSIGRNARGD
jgi:thiosulfate reductase cytochrome b subunit